MQQKRIFNGLILFFGALSLVFLSCKKDTKTTASAKPNIIYVLADDLGVGDISALNPEGKIATPHLDQLAKDGMVFTDAHTSSSVCTPTRYGILTGRYNWRSPLKNGVLTGASEALIEADRETVASLLKKGGYHTAFIGKWHLGMDWQLKDKDSALGEGWTYHDLDNIDFSKHVTNGPQTTGFDYSMAIPASLDMAPYVWLKNNKADHIPDTITESKAEYGWWRKGPTSSDFVHEKANPQCFEEAVSYVRSVEKSKPFYLMLSLPAPHTPILPTEEWQGKSGLNPYADYVLEIDHYMGLLMKTLEEKGVAENTMIVFTSDNGCSPQANFKVLGEKGHDPNAGFRGHKADIYEGGHRVPFIVKWPGKIKPSSVSDKVICTTDFMATCADLAEVELAETAGEDSFSMLPLFTTATEEAFGRTSTVHHSINGSFAIRKDEFKLIFCPGSGGWSHPKPNSPEIEGLPDLQLYDLKNDPKETENLVNKYPEKVAELTQLMKDIILNGRSTQGRQLENDKPFKGGSWEQIRNILN